MKLFLNIIIYLSINIAQDYNGPNDDAGDLSAVRYAKMDGNRILLKYENTTMLSDWSGTQPYSANDVSKWPNDLNGFKMLDGVALLVGGKTYIFNDNNFQTLDTQIIDDLSEVSGNSVHEVYFLQTAYREEMDQADDGLVKWGFYPVFGYMNNFSDSPAKSDDEDTWPSSWPAAGNMTKWPGEWDGRFGRGIQYADLETYFVVNDAQDQEYIQNKWECQSIGTPNTNELYNKNSECINECATYICADSQVSIYNYDVCESNCTSDCVIDIDYCYPTEPFEYYPIENKFIQDDASAQPGDPWGGLGIRVEARAFQWNNPLVRDALFWEYNISNISDYDINEMAFGYWVDNAIGGENDDEVGYFDTQLDLAYSWDDDATGFGGGTPGIMGFAFLESPGISNDLIDNDQDGLLDESRDNEAGNLICADCGIDNIDLFLETYDLDINDLKEHYEGDEDQDWVAPILDDDNNCILINDDVGLDGIGPNDVNYNGPDEGECNKKPDCVEGIGCEPNFGETDVSESDMLGLTSFKLFDILAENKDDPTSKWFENDDVMWDSLLVIEDIENKFDQFVGTPSNLVEVFSSAVFPLYKGKTERISMAELHSMDNIQGSPGATGSNANVPALFALKQTVQLIYETDYRFAVPPNIPTLTAEAGDEHVVLTWNDIAESSIDRFLPDSLQNDFEGYKIYRSTDKYFNDAQIITDGYGNPMFYDPIYQCDKIDSIKGFADYATIFGAAYYLGDDTGIEHKYIDNDVINGVTYYYAVVAYDYGLPPNSEIESGIPPSENNLVIQLDENEYVLDIGPNIAVVVPAAPSAGFIDPSVDYYGDLSGSGSIGVEVYSQSLVKDSSAYYITFKNDTDSLNYLSTSGFSIFDDADFCSGIDCEDISNEDECSNQFGCDWTLEEEKCINFPCEDYNETSDCNLMDECTWNNGIIIGSWELINENSDSLYLFGLNTDDVLAIKTTNTVNIFRKDIGYNDCYKFDFEFSEFGIDPATGFETEIYNFTNVSRFGNSECVGNLIYGYCDSGSLSVYNEDDCDNIEDSNWINYFEEYDINSISFWDFNCLGQNKIDCELNDNYCSWNDVTLECMDLNTDPPPFFPSILELNYISKGFKIIEEAYCDIGNQWGNEYCSAINNKAICLNDFACDWSTEKLLYTENGEDSPISFYQDHYLFRQENSQSGSFEYWTIDPDKIITTDVIEGLVFSIENIESGYFKNSNWLQTSSYNAISDPTIIINDRMSRLDPRDCKIVFTNETYQTSDNILLFNSPPINYYVRDEQDIDVSINASPPYTIPNNNGFSIGLDIGFYVYDEKTNFMYDLLVADLNDDGSYNPLEDKILVGKTYQKNISGQVFKLWNGTNFSISFLDYPSPGEIYFIDYETPFLSTDTLFINTLAPQAIDVPSHNIQMNNIKVVPNPYVGTNIMEENFSNPNQNQERKIMFTHLPAKCKIRIFTISGILVDEIIVNNSNDDGKAYWDLLTNEGLDVAAGMYIYHVESKSSNKYKLGKFAIIK